MTKIAKTMVGDRDYSWAKALPLAVEAHNKNSHSHLLGSAPGDVKGSPVLQFELERQSGLDLATNATINEQGRVAKLRELGAFRILMPKSTWSRAGAPRYDETVHEFLRVSGSAVKAVDGAIGANRDESLITNRSPHQKTG